MIFPAAFEAATAVMGTVHASYVTTSSFCYEVVVCVAACVVVTVADVLTCAETLLVCSVSRSKAASGMIAAAHMAPMLSAKITVGFCKCDDCVISITASTIGRVNFISFFAVAILFFFKIKTVLSL